MTYSDRHEWHGISVILAVSVSASPFSGSLNRESWKCGSLLAGHEPRVAVEGDTVSLHYRCLDEQGQVRAPPRISE